MSHRSKIYPYLVSIVLVSLTTLLGEGVKRSLEPTNLVMFYLLAVVISAVRWGRGPAMLTAVLSVLCFDFFLVPPYLTFRVSDFQYLFTFAGLFVVGLLVSTLTSKTREQAIAARQREMQTRTLYDLSKDLAISETFGGVLETVRKNMGRIFDCDAAIFLPDGNVLKAISCDTHFPLNEHERAIAAFVLKNGKSAGWGTDTLQASKARYVPLETSQGTFGVLALRFKREKADLLAEEDNLLRALASQAAVAIQRGKLADESRQMELLRQTEKLQTALLNSISHDLRTPLVSITGALSSLVQDASVVNDPTRKELLETAYEESVHLNRLVGNLLDMTRVEAGTLKIHTKPCDLRDVIGAALQQLKDKLEKREVRMNIPHDLPEIAADFSFLMRVFVNLTDNAIKYSPPETPIEIAARLVENHVRIEFKDRGFGIPQEDLQRIFDKFYRALNPRKITGTGLGLSICKGIVEAHGGEIRAENNADKGATFVVFLPLSAKAS